MKDDIDLRVYDTQKGKMLYLKFRNGTEDLFSEFVKLKVKNDRLYIFNSGCNDPEAIFIDRKNNKLNSQRKSIVENIKPGRYELKYDSENHWVDFSENFPIKNFSNFGNHNTPHDVHSGHSNDRPRAVMKPQAKAMIQNNKYAEARNVLINLMVNQMLSAKYTEAQITAKCIRELDKEVK